MPEIVFLFINNHGNLPLLRIAMEAVTAIVALFLYGKSNSIRTAYSELIRGTASEYDSRMNERYKTIYECSSDSCQVDSIKNVPKTLSEVQLTGDPMSNFNRWYSRYFHKKYVYLRK